MIANAGGAQGAQQIRRFGRFLFATKIKDFNQQLTTAIGKLSEGGTAGANIHVCCTLAAGTGSGSLIDAISQVRRLYPDRGAYPIYLYLLVTDKIVAANTGNFYANQYAALAELNSLRLGNFRPHDVAAVTPNRPELKDNYQQCYLISDENERHDTASREEQEQMIADFLYQKVVALKGAIPDQIHKAQSFEDVSQYPAENEERSYFYGSFGVKRFAIPEQEIREKLTFTFAKQASLQFQFNNWSDAGFIKQAQNRDVPELVHNPATLERWHITDEHLKLSTDFKLQGGKSWPRISQEWDTEIENEKLDLMETCPKSREKWLPGLRDFASKHFEKTYRDRGVVRYYDDKRIAKTDYAREIRLRIEADLFGRWKTGEDSIHDTARILDALVDYLNERKQRFDDRLIAERANEEDASAKLAASDVEWSKIGWASETFFGTSKRVFEGFTNALKDHYTARTEALSIDFAKELCQQVINQVSELRSHVAQSSKIIAKGAEEFEKMADSRCAREEEINFRMKLVRLVEPDNIGRTIQHLGSDRRVQMDQTQSARTKLCAILGTEQTFTAFSKRISEPLFIDTLSDACDDAASVAHENLFKVPSSDFRRIMGVNIVEKLHEQHGALTDELQRNVQTLVQSAAAYLTFDGNQTQPAVQLRNQNIASMPKGSIIVFLPRCPSLEQPFRADLKKTFESAIGGQPVQVVDADHNPNEITIISVRYWFALRFVKALAKLRGDYEAAIRSGEPTAVHQIHLENHREKVADVPLSAGYSTLPSLFLPDTSEVKREALPTLLLAEAMNLIKSLKDLDSGLESLQFAERNEQGRAISQMIDLQAHDLQTLLNVITPETFGAVSAKVVELLGEKWKHVDKRAELAAALDGSLDAVYVARGSNDMDKTYQQFFEANSEAKKILNR